MSDSQSVDGIRAKLREIIFEAETPAGKAFDLVLLWFVLLSVGVAMLETVEAIDAKFHHQLEGIEWFFTIAFTIEYVLRLWLSKRPWKYATSFYGIVDMMSCIPAYLVFFIAGGESAFAVVRVLRLMRMFRILKMVHYVHGAEVIWHGLARSKEKIAVFFFAILLIATIAGTLMFYVESGVEGSRFTSIPMSIYYAIVSISTVGYGDMVAQTDLGRFITTILILTGYAVIAVPTGIVTSELIKGQETDKTTDACPSCGVHGHLADATYCRRCGAKL
ncbi:ion transporter [Rubritalea marina]|uniref:ion transporter n=1 Tax=Rubritalea marina TaxID=361055 RepID=UPI000382604B|nr:ion transporter [Rubritalea marina]